MNLSPAEKPLRDKESHAPLPASEALSVARGLLCAKRLKIVPALVRLLLYGNDSKLVRGEGPYRDYFYGGANPLFAERMEFGDIRQFGKGEIVSALIEHGLLSDADPKASELLRSLVSKVAVGFDCHTGRLDAAYWKARERGSSLVLLSNHLSHLDAPMIDVALRDRGYAPRFVCGAFMFYNRHVRPFTRAFDTVFVFGPKDQKDLMKGLLSGESDREGKRKVLSLMETFNARVRDAIAEPRMHAHGREVVVLFPYAGRSQDDSGCKGEGIAPGMAPMLTDVRNVFLTMGTCGQRDAIPGGAGGNVVSNFSKTTPVEPTIIFWDVFEGGEKELSQIHESMVSVAEQSMARYRSRKIGAPE